MLTPEDLKLQIGDLVVQAWDLAKQVRDLTEKVGKPDKPVSPDKQ
jgi:hypothetical protein